MLKLLLSPTMTADVLANVAYGIGNCLTLGSDCVSLVKSQGTVEKINEHLKILSEVEQGPVSFIKLLQQDRFGKY